MSTTITLRINGRMESVVRGATVAQLLAQKKINPQTVVVELNMEILSRDTFAIKEVTDGDSMEILHFVGGG